VTGRRRKKLEGLERMVDAHRSALESRILANVWYELNPKCRFRPIRTDETVVTAAKPMRSKLARTTVFPSLMPHYAASSRPFRMERLE
jgi:hypothetical protein